MSKSFTTLEQHMCRVTGKLFDTGTLLLDKRLREKYEMHTITGWGYSPEAIEKFEEGYVALVEVDLAKSEVDENGQITTQGAWRLGGVCYIKKDVLVGIVPTIKINKMGFCDSEFLKYLSEIPIEK
jgi:hypothetical protein